MQNGLGYFIWRSCEYQFDQFDRQFPNFSRLCLEGLLRNGVDEVVLAEVVHGCSVQLKALCASDKGVGNLREVSGQFCVHARIDHVAGVLTAMPQI